MFNKVILLGRLTADPELRKTASDISVTNFTIAVNRKFAKEGAKNADFIECVAWRNTADFITKYFRKGTPILVEGELHIDDYEDNEGNRRWRTTVSLENATFAGAKQGGNSNSTEDTKEEVFEEPDDDGLPFN